MSPHLAQAFRILGKRAAHVTDFDDLGAGAPDPLILQYAAAHNQQVVTRDHAMKRLPQFTADVRRLGVGVFLVNTGGARQLDAWGITKLMVKAWDQMESFINANDPPFVALVKHNGSTVTFH